MHPNQALQDFLLACHDQDREAATDAVEALNDWLASADGFVPQIKEVAPIMAELLIEQEGGVEYAVALLARACMEKADTIEDSNLAFVAKQLRSLKFRV